MAKLVGRGIRMAEEGGSNPAGGLRVGARAELSFFFPAAGEQVPPSMSQTLHYIERVS